MPETPRTWTARDVGCPKSLCHAKAGEPCYKKTGRPMSGFHEEREARAAINGETFNIAYCPEHGVHGERDKCWECWRPVEQIPMRAVVSVDAERERLLNVIERLLSDDASTAYSAGGDAQALLREYGRLGHRRPGA